jgi:hypothetical protein
MNMMNNKKKIEKKNLNEVPLKSDILTLEDIIEEHEENDIGEVYQETDLPPGLVDWYLT